MQSLETQVRRRRDEAAKRAARYAAPQDMDSRARAIAAAQAKRERRRAKRVADLARLADRKAGAG